MSYCEVVGVRLLIAFACVTVGCGHGNERKTDAEDSSTGMQADSRDLLSNSQLKDLGVVLPGSEIEAKFTVKNESSVDWNVAAIKTPCSCISAKMSSSRIKPGGSESVVVRYRAPAKVLDEKRTVQIRFQEQDVSELELTIQCRVRKQLTVRPEQFDFGIVAHTSENLIMFQADNYFGQKWTGIAIEPVNLTEGIQLSDISVEEVLISGEVPLSGNPIQAWMVEATVKGPVSSGESSRFQLRVHAEDSREKFVENVEVRLRTESPIRSVPSKLFLGRLREGESVSKSVMVMVAKVPDHGMAPSIRVEGKSARIISVGDVKSSGRTITIPLLIKVPIGEPLDPIHAILRVTTAPPEGATLEIPVTGEVIEDRGESGQ